MKIESLDMDVVYPVLRQEAAVVPYAELEKIKKALEAGDIKTALEIVRKYAK